MNAVRIRRRLDAPIAELPELAPLVGKEVEIIALEAEDPAADAATGRPFEPVAGAWDGPTGEFDRLMSDSAAARHADAEFDRDGAP
jgi:hypothetical protein